MLACCWAWSRGWAWTGPSQPLGTPRHRHGPRFETPGQQRHRCARSQKGRSGSPRNACFCLTGGSEGKAGQNHGQRGPEPRSCGQEGRSGLGQCELTRGAVCAWSRSGFLHLWCKDWTVLWVRVGGPVEEEPGLALFPELPAGSFQQVGGREGGA